MSRMKYIVLEINGTKFPIIFPDSPELSHKAVWRGVQQGLRMQSREGNARVWAEVEPVSMGFVNGLSATSVDGYSESARYGFDCVPTEKWDVTTSHPETDLPLINGGMTLEQVSREKERVKTVSEMAVKVHVKRILTKQAPEAKHKSPPHRWAAAIKYATENGIGTERAHEFVAEIARAEMPGAYKEAL